MDDGGFYPHREKQHGLGAPSLALGRIEVWLMPPGQETPPGHLVMLAATVGEGAGRRRVRGGGHVSLAAIARARDGLAKLLQGAAGTFAFEGLPDGLFVTASASAGGTFRVESGIRAGGSREAITLLDDEPDTALKMALYDCEHLLKKFGGVPQ